MGMLSGILGGGGGKQSSTTSVNIPKWLKPIVKPLYQQSATIGQQIAAQPYQRYGGQRVADITPGMRSAISGIQGNVNNPMLAQSKGYTSDVLGGKYLKGNPYLEDVLSSSRRGITDTFNKTMRPQMEANLARQGAFGGSGWQQANADMSQQLAQQLADLEGNLRYQDYGTERGYQNQAAGQATNLAGIDLSNLQAALSASDIDRQKQQAELDAQYGDFTEQRDWLFRALQGLQGGLGNVSGLYGQTGTSKGGGGSSGLAGLLGGAGQLLAGYGSLG